MTLGEAIKTYRIENGISQAELASKLEVSAMKVSRLENNQTIRIEPKLAKAIADVLGEERINSIDEGSTSLLVLKRVNSEAERKDVRKEEWKKAAQSCRELLRDIFSDWPVDFDTTTSNRSLADFIVKYESKTWLFDVVAYADKWPLLSSVVASRIGHAAMEPEVSRYTLIWCTESTADWESIRPIQTFNNLNFDMTLLHFNIEKRRFDFEMDISSRFDGNGFFDIAVPEKADVAAKLFAKWKASLSGHG